MTDLPPTGRQARRRTPLLRQRALQVAWLTGLWLILWRDISVASVVSGLLLALAATAFYQMRPFLPDPYRVSPYHLLVFASYFLWKLLVSNVVVARAILSPLKRTRTGIVAVPVAGCSDLVITVVANAITLTPGTMTLEVSDARDTLYVHVLHVHDLDAVRRDTLRLLRLALRGFGYTGSRTMASLDAAEAAAWALSPQRTGGTDTGGEAPPDAPDTEEDSS